MQLFTLSLDFFFGRTSIKNLYISRSALSCCILTGIPHQVIKHYCLPRDMTYGNQVALVPDEWYIVDNDEIGDE